MIRFLVLTTMFAAALASRSQTVSNIYVEGNKKTDTDYILRFLVFNTGDSMSSTGFTRRLEQSRDNLINSTIFSNVKITSLPIDGVYTDILIQVEERWYVWPLPDITVYETNFNTWIKNIDFSRISYGIDLVHQNLKGKGIKLIAFGSLGYVKAAGVEFRLPYLGKSNFGLDVHASYAERAEFVYGTENNMRLFYTNPKSRKVLSRSQLFGTLYYHFNQRSKIRLNNTFSNYLLNDSLSTLNEILPDKTNEANLIQTSIGYRSDQRDYQSYPLSGSYMEIDFQNLLYINKAAHQLLKVDLRAYAKLISKVYLGGGLMTKIGLSNNLPYQFGEALGYRHYVRGYENYVIDGQHHALAKTNVKYQIINRSIKTHNGLPNAFKAVPLKVFATIFADLGYVWGLENNFDNDFQRELLSGVGIGLDFVSFFEKVMRIEFSKNHINEYGLFVHFTQPI